jgi:amino acid transporter
LRPVAGNQQALLSYLGRLAGGDWLAYLVSIDAVLVLSGAVLTSYVGVGGLVHRMTLDRCLPQFLLKLNKRGTTYRIMIAFFILCVSILLITKGELGALAGVYALSFLSVMALFALGNILLKFRRARLPRPERASWLGGAHCAGGRAGGPGGQRAAQPAVRGRIPAIPDPDGGRGGRDAVADTHP